MTSPLPAIAPSALTAAISMGRFLARNPQFSQLDELEWKPRPDGLVLVHVKLTCPTGAELICELRQALEFRVPVAWDYTSPHTHLPMVSLTLRGKYEATLWRIEAQVEAAAYAAARAGQLVGAA